MDIVDIDEALKDDSFICLEGKTHDDVSNILQQWKSNSCVPPQSKEKPLALNASSLVEQAFNLNSRTFTRPKRRPSHSIETLLSNIAGTPYPMPLDQEPPRSSLPPSKLNLNMEIGGLVGGHNQTMHKSLLQDTSPPSSIASSMDASIDRMNSSLVTSADFSNISSNFLQSTTMQQAGEGNCFNLADKATSDGYTLSDMIRDRKALESLTLSGEGTLIKDSHIGQIDDISLAFSKTASGCSTMENSTESDGGMAQHHNRTVVLNNANQNHTYDNVVRDAPADRGGNMRLDGTTVLSDEMIGDTTFHLVDNSLCLERGEQSQLLNITRDVQQVVRTTDESAQSMNATFKQPLMADETVCLSDGGKSNKTFDGVQQQQQPQPATPENIACEFYESTPQAASARSRTKHLRQYTPLVESADVANISPIVPTSRQQQPTRLFDETFEKDEAASVAAEVAAATIQSPQRGVRTRRPNRGHVADTFVGALPQLESLELLENVPNPNSTYEAPPRNTYGPTDHSAADAAEMQSVMDMAQAEADLLAGNGDEDEFDHMLDQVSRVEMNEEQVKMKKSLDEIKKRFSCALSGGGGTEISREARDMREMMRSSDEVSGYEVNAGGAGCGGSEWKGDEIRRLRQQLATRGDGSTAAAAAITANADLKISMLSSKDFGRDLREGLTSSTQSNAGGAGSVSGERLLMRRGRLYDDVNLPNLSIASKASYTIMRHEETTPVAAQSANPSEYKTERDEKAQEQEETGDNAQIAANAKQDSQTSRAKILERRQRDRDRFKTMKVYKTSVVQEDGTVVELNLPCIDDDYAVEYPNPAPVFNNNKSEVDVKAKREQARMVTANCLTYRKQREAKHEEKGQTMAQPAKLNSESRTILSRPRYISGLQEFTTAAAGTSDANSAEDLSAAADTELGHVSNKNLSDAKSTVGDGEKKTQRFNRSQPTAESGKAGNNSDLPSPMGVKSKSHGNLSSNFGYSGASCLQPPRASAYGLKKPTAYGGSGLGDKQMKTPTPHQQQQPKSQKDDAAFKVPKLVSGIRAPSNATRLARPSSGYYSLSTMSAAASKTAAITACHAGELPADAERCSPTDSISSVSSRGSGQSCSGATTGDGLRAPIATPSALPTAPAATAPYSRNNSGHTGIPKPSGLRPPTTIKRSGLRAPHANPTSGRQ